MTLSRFALALAVSFVTAGPKSAPAAEGVPSASRVVVHEWGTFTSVAGKGGEAVYWSAFSGQSDLPCFVNRIGGWNPKAAMGLVRMETPVLYFYSPTRATVSVHVDFPQGIITEWYPRASRVQPAEVEIGGRNSRIDWGPVEIAPGETAQLPSSKAASHYFAARETDAGLLKIGSEREKMLFYRGIGAPAVPLAARFAADGKLEIRNTGAETIPVAIVFENRAGRVGYRILRGIERRATVESPELSAPADSLRRDLAATLVEAGLFPKEAQAMLATWGDSWFQEGMRVFYILPRAAVDRALPLRVTPAPESTARVFVGRVEVLSPAAKETIQTALQAGDAATLRKYGRFLDAFLRDMNISHMAPAARAFVDASYQQLAKEFEHPACVQ